MPNNVVQFTIKGNSKEAIEAMNRMRAAMRTVAKVAAVVGAALVAAFTAVIKPIIDVGSKVENLKIRLNALLGSTNEGSKAFSEMAKFASTVPFSFDAIMESATTLAGVVTGGVDEISKMMPIIADLATVSGLSIQDTTSQVQRMMAGGAAAADMFRERGITAMLGFEAGVSVSAKETKRRLIEAFEDPASKFRDASKKMATTWDGVLSMIGDKWFTFKNNIADAGIFNYIKAIAITIDNYMGRALKASGDTAKSWSDFLINSINRIIKGVGFLADIFRGLNAVWVGLKIAFAVFAEGVFRQLVLIEKAVKVLLHAVSILTLDLMEIPVEKFILMETSLGEATKRTKELKEEFNSLTAESMPSEEIALFSGEVERTFADLNALAVSTTDNIKAVVAPLSEFQLEWNSAQKEFLTQQSEYYKTFAESFHKTMSKTIDSISSGIAGVIVDGGNLMKVFEGIAKDLLKTLLSSLIKMSIQKLITDKAAVAGEVSKAGAGGTASMAAAPFPINLGAPAFGASMAAAAAGFGAIGIAHGGLSNVPAEATYLLDKGERVLSPNQNSDFTSFINGNRGGGSSGVSIENVEIHILENATNAQSLLDMDEKDLEEIVATKIIGALDSLDRKGVRPLSAERE